MFDEVLQHLTGAGDARDDPGVRRYRAPMAEMHDATEEYLETILELEEEGIVPIRARLVERLGVSAPAVSEQVNRLVGGGYTELLDDRSLRLTSKGRKLATTVVRRHRLAERLLVDVIGLEWEKVHREADLWEHVISEDVEAKLVELLGDPATCPHGNPIPGLAQPVRHDGPRGPRRRRARPRGRGAHQREGRARQGRARHSSRRRELIPGRSADRDRARSPTASR